MCEMYSWLLDRNETKDYLEADVRCMYATKEEAIAKFYTDEVRLDCWCEDVFGNG